MEEIGVEVARRFLRAAQIVLYCAEAGRDPHPGERRFLDDIEPERLLRVRTKADESRGAAPGDGVLVSALTGVGLPALRDALLLRAFGGIAGVTGEAPLVTRERHARALRSARAELELFRAALRERVPMEFAATHLGAAAGALEDLIGLVTPDDVLGAVFGQFCVGK